MGNLLLGVVIGAIFSPILIKLFQYVYNKITKKVDNLPK